MFKSTVQRPKAESTPRQGLGYFAFPPPNACSFPPPEPEPDNATPLTVEDPAYEEELKQKELEEQHRRADAEQKRKAFEASMAAEALRGEEYWVRCGGVLLDKHGRKDFARTNAIREELRLRDLETTLTERWKKYEDSWKALTIQVRNGQSVSFSQVPWPVIKEGEEITTADLTVTKVEEFLLADLQVRGTTVTRKERIRSSLLRWHPDKLAGLGLFRNVSDTDREAVTEGVGAVARCLHQLNST